MTDSSQSHPVYAAIRKAMAGGAVKGALLLQRAKAKYSGEPDFFCAAAAVARERLNYAEALNWARRAVNDDPEQAPALVELALAQHGLARDRRAIDLLRRAAAQADRAGEPALRDQCTLRLAETLLELDDTAGAVPVLSGISDASCIDDAKALLAHCHALLGTEGVPLAPPATYGFNASKRAANSVTLGCRDTARWLALRLLRVLPNDGGALAGVAVWQMDRGDFEQAERLFGQAMFSGPSNPAFVAAWQGLLFCRMHEFERALQFLESPLVARAKNPELRANAAECRRRLGDIEAAKTQARGILAEYPETDLAKTVIWRTEGGGPRAAESERDALALEANPNISAHILYFIAERTRAENPGLAQRIARRAIALRPLATAAGDWGDAASAPDAKIRAPVSSVTELAGLYATSPEEGRAWPAEDEIALLRALFAPEAEAQAAVETWLASRDIEHLSLGAYRLLPMLYPRLPADAVAENPALRIVSGLWRKSYAETVAHWRQALPVLDDFAAANIPVMLMKGGAYAERLYGSWGARPMSDFDILVPQSQAHNAATVLRRHGWTARRALDDARLHFQYALTFRNPKGGTLDLHWRPSDDFSGPGYDERTLWEASAAMEVFCRTLRIPDASFGFFHTVTHGIRWNHISPVRWVADAHLQVAKAGEEIDPTRLWNFAQRFDCVLPLSQGLKFLRETFPTLAPALDRLRRAAVAPGSHEQALMRQRLRAPSEQVPQEDMPVLADRLLKRMEGAGEFTLVVTGGTEPDRTRAWCEAEGHRWLDQASTSELETLWKALGGDGLVCLDGDLNGKWYFIRPAED